MNDVWGRLRRSTLAVAASLIAPVAANAAPENFATYHPSFEAARITHAEAPKIDGDLSDPAWARATVLDDFYQTDPVNGATPSECTRAFVMYDETHIYVAVYAYDSEPGKIGSQLMARDAQMGDGDAIRILFDPFQTRRDGYYFAMNPNGAKTDALAENNSTFRPEWDAIWDGAARVVSDGWIAEFAIPFRSMSFDASSHTWGFQIARNIRRKNEWIRWSNIDRTRGVTDFTNVGEMRGVTVGNTGLGLDIQTFTTGQWVRDWTVDPVTDNFKLKPSGNIFYKITPALTGTVTLNTDFSDTPLDERQVNTGRFNLFFPETRDFFLQDAAVFEFGGRTFNNDKNGQPFFSRQIGLADGAPADILAGVKLSGKTGPVSIGVLSTQTKSAGAIDGQTLSVLRASVPVLNNSRAGVILTNGDPLGKTDNTVAGTDFQYKNTDLIGTGTLFADFGFLRSWQDGDPHDLFGSEIAYRADKWNSTLRLKHIDEGFDPRLGFVNRAGIRRYNANTWRNWRPENSFLRRGETGGWTNIVTDLDNVTVDRAFGLWAGGVNNPGDELWFRYEYDWTDIRAPFEIAGVVPVGTGKYQYEQYDIEARSTRSRPVAIGGHVRWGGVYDGDFFRITPDFTLRPSKHFEFAIDYSYSKFSLPSGAVAIHIATTEINVNFTPNLTFQSQMQYDNISENFSYFGRLRWEPKPGTQILFAINHTALIAADGFPSRFDSTGTSATIRLGHTFRM